MLDKKIYKCVQSELQQDISPAEVFKAFQDYAGARYFFAGKTEGEWLLGIGHAKRIIADDIDPLATAEKFADIFSSYTYEGLDQQYLRFFGGFQFDDGNNADYAAFGHSHFILPKLQLLKTGGRLILSIASPEFSEADLLARLSQVPSDPLPALVSAVNIDAEDFLQNVAAAVEEMQQEHFQKVVLSRRKRLTLSGEVASHTLIERALAADEQSYFVLLEEGGMRYVSKTPEQLVKVEGSVVQTNAIAGTMARAEDAKARLLADHKNLGEHQIVVDSIVQDLTPFASKLDVPAGPGVLDNRYFHHLYTPISGELASGNILDISLALHPTPALGGFPKDKAARFIRQNEASRGFYGAPMGYVAADLSGEFVVAIRSMLLSQNEALLYAGCGVVSGSNPEDELYETEIKFKPMLQLLGVTL